MQAALMMPKQTKDNPFFNSKYAGLSDILEAIKKPLTDNGLAVTQVTEVMAERLILETVLMHTSGEWISCTYPIEPVQKTPQGMGSALTYARRYSLSALLGVASEEDDDGNEASKKPAPKAVKKSEPITTTPQPQTTPATCEFMPVSCLPLFIYFETSFTIKWSIIALPLHYLVSTCAIVVIIGTCYSIVTTCYLIVCLCIYYINRAGICICIC